MYDLITIGNASIDLYFQGKTLTHSKDRFQLALGGKYYVDFFSQHFGGGGLNVAVGVAHHGLKAALISFIGEHLFTDNFLKYLEEKGVSKSLLIKNPQHIKISSIYLNEVGEKTIVTYESKRESYLDKDSSLLRKIINTKTFYMGNLPDLSLEEKRKILTVLKENGVTVFLNMGVSDCRKKYNSLLPVLKKADFIILNTHEFSDLVKKSYSEVNFEEDVTKYTPGLEDKTWIITNGKNGSFAYQDQKVFRQSAIKTVVRDTTGAGDAFCAGVISAYLKGLSLQKIMKSGAIYSSHILSKVGAN